MNKGFTLVEIIVSIAVFLIVIGAGVAIFISIIQYQRNILSQQELFNQMSYVQEKMSKAIRMAERDMSGDCVGADYAGQNYSLSREEDGFYTGIKFLNASDSDSQDNPACEEFYLDTSTHILMEKRVTLSSTEVLPITSTKLNVNSIKFGFDGTSGCSLGGAACPNGDEKGTDFELLQPRITVVINVKSKQNIQAPLQVFQTTISQRNLNVK